MKYIMLDIETMGTLPGSVITSISAVEFNEKGETGDELHIDIDLKSCFDVGLKTSADTIKWWLEQEDEARKGLYDPEIKRVPISSALHSFGQWVAMRKAGGFEKVFSKDPDFDCVLLEAACQKTGAHYPFKHKEKIAVRTLSWLKPIYEKQEEFVGVKHNGLDDCKHQIKYVTKILNDILKVGNPSVH